MWEPSVRLTYTCFAFDAQFGQRDIKRSDIRFSLESNVFIKMLCEQSSTCYISLLDQCPNKKMHQIENWQPLGCFLVNT